MNIKTLLFASALTGATVFAGCNSLGTEKDNTGTTPNPEASPIHVGGDMPSGNDMMKQSSESGKMLPYTPENLDTSIANGETVVLAFAADWCPSCQAVEKDIMKNIDDIPVGITLIRANFDTESELKSRYKVKGQHTFVQLDSNKNAVKTWRGSSSLKALLDQVETEAPKVVPQKAPSTPPTASPKALAPTSGKMLPYTPENLDTSIANGETVILAFAADWCPSCQAVEKDIMKNIDDIPAGITLIRANFDTESELKSRYKVKGQHTFVQLDSNKNAVKTWRGSSSLKDLLAQIQ